MKFFAPLIVGAIAFLSSQVDANGVCYDPNHGTGMDASSVQADMHTIASHGFDSVRTFISAFGGVEIGPIIAAAGLKAMLGVPYPQSDCKDQMAAAIKAAQSGGVYAIMVGNENLAGASSVPGDMISVIQQIKSQVPKGVLVGTVQRNTEAIEHDSVSGWWDLVSACDILGVNAHPYFTPNTVVDNAIQVLNNQWQTMSGTYGSKLILTETGWPSSGNLMGNVGSVAGAELFYNAYQQWSSSMGEKFYFQMFDTPYRGEEYEKNFGVVTSNGQNKFSMSVQASVSIGQPNQQDNQQNNQQQQQTPFTDAPTYQQQTPNTDAPRRSSIRRTADSGYRGPYATTPHRSYSDGSFYSTGHGSPTAAPPTGTPAIYQNSGSVDYNTTTSGSSEVSVGSASTSTEASESSDNEQQTNKSGKTGTTTQQTTQNATPTGTNSQAQQQDDVQQANTQSSGGGAATTMVFGIAGAACAALVAFGFIYQSRKHAAQLEDVEAKHNGFAVTPMQNHCAL